MVKDDHECPKVLEMHTPKVQPHRHSLYELQ
jgi:hypothetical protein